jgi:ATP-binding protein involved in chromosome partitioning
LDPRLVAIDQRLAPVRRILCVTGGKGGIGKSSVASLLALMLTRRGLRTGLLDLDLTGPCDHVILGAGDAFPSEEFGIEPPTVHGIQFMSVAWFLRDRPVALRGADLTNALVEILAITHWAEAEVLVVDMPPGLGDTALDVARWLPRAESLVVAGSSLVVLETVRRMLGLLRGLGLPVAGVVDNMQRLASEAVPSLAEAFGVPFLGALPFDEGLEAALGDAEKLAQTELGRAVEQLGEALLAAPQGPA